MPRGADELTKATSRSDCISASTRLPIQTFNRLNRYFINITIDGYNLGQSFVRIRNTQPAQSCTQSAKMPKRQILRETQQIRLGRVLDRMEDFARAT